MVKLGEVIEKPISGEWGEGEGETYVLRTTNFRNDGSLNFENVVRRNISEKKIREKSLKPGDCIIEKSGGGPSQPVGRVVYFDNPNGIYLCNNFTSIVRPKADVYPKYLFWYLFNNHLIGNTLSYQNKTTGIINLQLERYVSESYIPLPPLATQQRIADILDKADALRRKDQALLQKYDELAQAVFVEMFGDPVKNEKGWEVKFLRDCFSSKPRIGTIKPVTSDGTIKVVRVSEIGKLNINLEKSKKVIIEKNEKERYLLQENDIVLARAIGSIDHLGKASLVKNLKEDVVFDSHVMRLQFNQKLLNSYFFYTWLQSPGGRKIFLENSSQTAVQFNINAEQISRIKIAVPPINIQCKFEKSILDIYQQITFLNLSHSTALFQSLLQKAFTGELVP